MKPIVINAMKLTDLICLSLITFLQKENLFHLGDWRLGQL